MSEPLLLQQTPQEMLGPDVRVSQRIGFVYRVLEHALRVLAEPDFDRGGELLDERHRSRQLAADLGQGQTGQKRPRVARLVAKEAQEQVRGVDGSRAEPRGLVPREEQRTARRLREALDHDGGALVRAMRTPTITAVAKPCSAWH